MNATRSFSTGAQILLPTGSVAIICSALLIGVWLSARLQTVTVNRVGAAAALAVNQLLAPTLHDTHGDRFKLNRPNIDSRLQNLQARGQLLSLVIWQTHNRRQLFGDSLDPANFNIASDAVEKAWRGVISTHLVNAHSSTITRVSSPLRSTRDGRVLAVAEFLYTEPELGALLHSMRIRLWLLITSIAAGMIAILFWTRLQIEHKIELTKMDLDERVRLAVQMKSRLENIQSQIDAGLEPLLTSTSCELLLETKQDIEVALSRLKRVYQGVSDEDSRTDLAIINDTLLESIREIQEISGGKSLPELAKLSLNEICRQAIGQHQQRTGVSVALTSNSLPVIVSPQLKICIYRFLQETLFNAYQHGKSTTASVQAMVKNDTLQISVYDPGCGFDPDETLRTGSRLGIAGLRNRIHSVGGDIQFDSEIGLGTRVTVKFTVAHDLKSSAVTAYDRPQFLYT